MFSGFSIVRYCKYLVAASAVKQLKILGFYKGILLGTEQCHFHPPSPKKRRLSKKTGVVVKDPLKDAGNHGERVQLRWRTKLKKLWEQFQGCSFELCTFWMCLLNRCYSMFGALGIYFVKFLASMTSSGHSYTNLGWVL